MLLGRVVGSLVASRKEPLMEGFKFLVLRQVGVDGKESGGYVVAVEKLMGIEGRTRLSSTPPAARPVRR